MLLASVVGLYAAAVLALVASALKQVELLSLPAPRQRFVVLPMVLSSTPASAQESEGEPLARPAAKRSQVTPQKPSARKESVTSAARDSKVVDSLAHPAEEDAASIGHEQNLEGQSIHLYQQQDAAQARPGLDLLRVATPPRPVRDYASFQVRGLDRAKKSGVTATIVVRLRIDVYGRVMSVALVSGVGSELDREAMRLAKTFRFHPAQNSLGTAVPTVVEWTFRVKP